MKNLTITRLAVLGILALLLPACGMNGGGTLTPTIAPGIPSNLSARGGDASVTLDWTESAEGSQYTVFRSLLPDGPFFPISVPAGFQGPTRYVDTGLTNGTTYYYQTAAQNSFGQSPPSSAVKGTPGFKALQVAGSSDDFSCLAVLLDGTVWQWGNSPSGFQFQTPTQVSGLSDVTAVSCGMGHALALRSDGTVWVWGDNTQGQLGVPGAGITTDPIPVVGPTGIVAVSAGGRTSMALTHDGNVLVWGTNTEGELGTGQTTPDSAPAPQPLPGLSDIVAVSAGSTHGLALRRDGLVFTWGDNTTGELGLGSTSSTPGAVAQVPGLTGITAIAAGYQYSLALRSDGSVWGWGSNLYGQLGIDDGRVNFDPQTPVNLIVPTQVPGVSGVVGISASQVHSAVVRSDGSVWTWGDNYYGALGNGTPGDVTLHPVPGQADRAAGIVQVAASVGNCIARGADGSVWVWGDNFNGGLGTGTAETVRKPIELPNVTGATAIAGGAYFTLFARTPGTPYAFGVDDLGQCGDGGANDTVFTQPFVVVGPAGVTALAAGDGHGLALTSVGEVWGWGQNDLGQVGNGKTFPKYTYPEPKPVKVVPNGMIAITAGRYHSLGIRKDPGTGVQTAWAWGYDEYGTCGQGNAYTYNPSTGHTPDPPLVTPSPVVNLTGVVSVAAGQYHSLAALSDGTVWAWGPNVSGCIGQPYTVIGGSGGSPLYTTTPLQVPGISNAVAVASGWFFSMALLADGTVMVWGDGSDGEYGIGDAVIPLYSQTGPTPVQVQGLTGVVAIVAGSRYAMALKSDGTVWSWGDNSYGQLGNNSLGVSGVAAPVLNLGPAVQIAAGQTHSMARLANGTIWLWGQNQYAELGTVPVDADATPQILTR